MTKKPIHGLAKHRIPVGATVLCRGGDVRRAPREIANGTAKSDGTRKAYRKGEWVSVEPVQGLGERDLHAMAAGPIMEPLRLFLPAGKVSEAEYQERLALDFARAGISKT